MEADSKLKMRQFLLKSFFKFLSITFFFHRTIRRSLKFLFIRSLPMTSLRTLLPINASLFIIFLHVSFFSKIDLFICFNYFYYLLLLLIYLFLLKNAIITLFAPLWLIICTTVVHYYLNAYNLGVLNAVLFSRLLLDQELFYIFHQGFESLKSFVSFFLRFISKHFFFLWFGSLHW